ncbi:hypothetical protein [Paenibacillus sp. GCM10012306]
MKHCAGDTQKIVTALEVEPFDALEEIKLVRELLRILMKTVDEGKVQ